MKRSKQHNPVTPPLVEWSGHPAPEAPDDWWVDDETGEYVNTESGERLSPKAARARIADDWFESWKAFPDTNSEAR